MKTFIKTFKNVQKITEMSVVLCTKPRKIRILLINPGLVAENGLMPQSHSHRKVREFRKMVTKHGNRAVYSL